jgi:DNA repair protein RadC
MPRRARQLTLFETFAKSLTSEDQDVVRKAVTILERNLKKPGAVFSTPSLVKDYLRLNFANQLIESFVALWLTAQNALITSEIISQGTLTQTSVYPREVLRRAMFHNAAAVIFAHPHPSGVAEPSQADQILTNQLKQTLDLVSCKVWIT